jgi:hypothetical protein
VTVANIAVVLTIVWEWLPRFYNLWAHISVEWTWVIVVPLLLIEEFIPMLAAIIVTWQFSRPFSPEGKPLVIPVAPIH